MDRDIFLFEKMNEIYDNKISFMIDSLNNQLKINMLEAQYKVITESGTKEDFEYLYMEAQEQMKEKKKSIFNSIIEWVKKIKDKIVDFFTKKKIEKKINDLPDKFQIDEGYEKQFKGFKKFHEWLIRPINLFKQKNYKALTFDLIKKGAEITSTAIVINQCNNIISMNKPFLKECANWILKVFKTDCDEILKVFKINDDDSLPIKNLKVIISMINKLVSSALNWCIIVPSKAISNIYSKSVEKTLNKTMFRNHTISKKNIDKMNENDWYEELDDGILDKKTGKFISYDEIIKKNEEKHKQC
jgi:hypothetical protein